jgi:hypothetical protein
LKNVTVTHNRKENFTEKEFIKLFKFEWRLEISFNNSFQINEVSINLLNFFPVDENDIKQYENLKRIEENYHKNNEKYIQSQQKNFEKFFINKISNKKDFFNYLIEFFKKSCKIFGFVYSITTLLNFILILFKKKKNFKNIFSKNIRISLLFSLFSFLNRISYLILNNNIDNQNLNILLSGFIGSLCKIIIFFNKKKLF